MRGKAPKGRSCLDVRFEKVVINKAILCLQLVQFFEVGIVLGEAAGECLGQVES